MDTHITGILIGSFSTALLGAVGWVFKAYIFDNSAKRKRYQEMLELIYSPLINFTEDDADITCAEVRDRVATIVKNHHTITPMVLANWNFPYYNDNKKFECSNELFLHIQTRYNWLKKKLGYDYEKKKITNKHLPYYNLVVFLLIMGEGTIILVPLLYVFICVVFQSKNNLDSLLDVTLTIPVVFLITWWLANAFFKLKKEWGVS